MDEDLQLIYRLREEYDAVAYRHEAESPSKHDHIYTFSKGIAEDIPARKTGEVNLTEDGSEKLEYTLDRVRDKHLLRMSMSFEELDELLSE